MSGSPRSPWIEIAKYGAAIFLFTVGLPAEPVD